MNLKFKIHELAKGKGLNTAYKLHKRAILSPPTAYRLYHNKTRQITLETMEKICFALDCEPADLFARKN